MSYREIQSHQTELSQNIFFEPFTNKICTLLYDGFILNKTGNVRIT